MASRDIKMLTPKMQDLYKKFAQEMARAGHQFIVTSTARTVKEQVALYAQGRQGLSEVNVLRKIVGMLPISDKENKRKVTWTLKSEHLIDLDDNDPSNDKSRAFDIVLCTDPRTVYWDTKADVDKDGVPDYVEAGKIGEQVGLVWGGRWSNPDYPHFQQPK
jgi:hypothetical protein